MNKLFILITISLISLYINFRVYKSYVLQDSLLSEFNKEEVMNSTFEMIKDEDFNFPNITATTLPLVALKANYYYRFGDLDTALNLLNIKVNDNPHWYLKEFLKSLIYNDIGVRDSSLYYSKLAFEGLPNNIAHFEKYAVNLAIDKDIESLNDAFAIIDKNNNILVRIYLGILLNLNQDFDVNTLNNVSSIIDLHYTDNEIFGMANSILYGKSNMDKALEYTKIAEEFFATKDYNNALIHYNKAITLFPRDYSYYENAALSAHLASKNQESLKLIQISMDSFPSRGDGKAEYIKALALIEIGQSDEACKTLRISRKKNFKQSFQLINKTCN